MAKNIQTGDKIMWIFADYGWRQKVAEQNPLRWSMEKSLQGTVSDLKKTMEEEGQRERPVKLKIYQCGTDNCRIKKMTLHFDTVVAATDALSEGEKMDFHVGEKVVLAGSHGDWIGTNFEVTITNVDSAGFIDVEYPDDGGTKRLSFETFDVLRGRDTKDFHVGQQVTLRGDHGPWLHRRFNATIVNVNTDRGSVEVKYSEPDEGSKVIALRVFQMLLVHIKTSEDWDFSSECWAFPCQEQQPGIWRSLRGDVFEVEAKDANRLGKGCFGVVYKGRYAGQDVAAKSHHFVMNPSMSNIDQMEVLIPTLRDLLQEIRPMAALGKHRNILEFIGVAYGEQHGLNVPTWILTAKAERALSDMILPGLPRLPLKQIEDFAGGLSEGLHYIHEKGLVHRDIKPPNLLVMKDDHLVIADLGLAKLTDRQGVLKTVHCGSPSYLGSEGGTFCAPSRDIFAAGCVLLECVLQTPPKIKQRAEQIKTAVKKLEEIQGANSKLAHAIKSAMHENHLSRPSARFLLATPQQVTPKPTPHSLPPRQGHLFVCGQITKEVRKRMDDLKPTSMKLSLPSNNRNDEIFLPDDKDTYDIPAYGPALTKALTTLLTVDVVKKQAGELRFMMPRCSMNEAIQVKVTERGPMLVKEIELAGGDAEAVKKLDQFVTKVGNLKARDFVSVDGQVRTDGKSWLDDFVPRGWERKLDADEVLTNFGFSDDFSKNFGDRVNDNDKEKRKWRKFAVEWLAKAFDMWSYQGSKADVVNLIYAMLGKPNVKPNEKHDIEHVVQTVQDFTEILRKEEWHKIIWKPTYLIHDSQLDDMLVWLLCVTIGSKTGSNTYCAVQMPPSECSLGQLDYLQAQYESRSTDHHRITVFRDPDSKNVDHVLYAACFVPPRFVYLVSETEMRSFVGKYYWDQESNMFQSGQRRLYIHPATGYWSLSLDGKGMKKGYYQGRALKKGWIPHTNLGWRMLVQTENNPENIGKELCQQTWEEGNKGRQAKWMDLNSKGMPTSGEDKSKPDDERPVFEFWISEDPREHPESAPVCRHCRQEATCEGWTCCEKHRPVNRKQNADCEVYLQACKYLEELGVDDFIDHKWDHCWCPSCHPADKNDTINDPSTCIVPRGWVAFGVVFSHHLRDVDKETILSWPNTFHGTRADIAQAYLQNGHIGMPGDRMTDGSALESKNCAGRQDKQMFYTSPTVAYVGLQVFARPRRSTQMEDIVGQVVLQCNQNREPDNIKKEQAEDLGFKADGAAAHKLCKHISLYAEGSQAIEVASERPDLCVIRRLLIRTFREDDLEACKKLHSPADRERQNSTDDGCLWL